MAPTDKVVRDRSDSEESAIRVLHVTEAFGGGIASALEAITAQTPDFAHGLAYTPAREAPAHETSLRPFTHSFDLGRTHHSRIGNVSRAVRAFRPDIIHAHSAYGGVYARVAPVGGVPVVYTPHCFAYHREDFGVTSRLFFRSVEMLLRPRTAVFAACSAREAKLAAGTFAKRPTVYVPNALPEPPSTTEGCLGGEITLVGIGRANHQKDPQFFASAARTLLAAGTVGHAVWIGDGDARHTEPLRQAGVDVRGWRPRSEIRELLAQPGTVYLHSARWEGFPIAILEAFAAGAPIIVRDISSFEGVNFPMMARSPGDVGSCIDVLRSADGAEQYRADISAALEPNSWLLQGQAIREVYRRALRTKKSEHPMAIER